MMMERAYMAGTFYEANTSWFPRGLKGLKTLYNKSASSPMRCSIVGIVSPDDLHMESHGNFDADGGSDAANRFRDAQYTLTLRNPGDAHPQFAADFTKSVQIVKDLAGNLPETNASVLPFIDESDGKVSLRFSRAVFEKFVSIFVPLSSDLLYSFII